MARDFDGTADYLSATSSPTDWSGNAGTLAAWVYPDTTTDDCVISLGYSGAATEYVGIFLNGTNVEARIRAGGTTSTATKSGLATGSWQHVGATYPASTDRYAWLNGVAGTVSSATRDPTNAMDRVAVGALRRSTVSTFADCKIAEAAIWSVELTTAEMEMLAAGYSPLFVRPQSLLAYWPLHGRAGASGDEEDWEGGTTLTQTSSPALFDHPRIIYPKRQIWVPVSAGGGGTTYTITPSGGLTFAGTSIDVKGKVIATSGGVTFAGTGSMAFATTGTTYTISPTGGITFAGTGVQVRSKTITPTGGLTFSGTGLDLRTKVVNISGGVTFGGTGSMTSNTSIVTGTVGERTKVGVGT